MKSKRQIFEERLPNMSIDEKRELAQSENTPKYILEKLTNENYDKGIHEGIAGNRNATGHVLYRLASMRDANVYKLIINHPNVNGKILKKIIETSQSSRTQQLAKDKLAKFEKPSEDYNKDFETQDYKDACKLMNDFSIKHNITGTNWSIDKDKNNLKCIRFWASINGKPNIMFVAHANTELNTWVDCFYAVQEKYYTTLAKFEKPDPPVSPSATSQETKELFKRASEASDYTVKNLRRIIKKLESAEDAKNNKPESVDSKSSTEIVDDGFSKENIQKLEVNGNSIVILDKEIKAPTFSEQVGYRMSCDLISSATKDFIVSVIKTQSNNASVLDITQMLDNEIGEAVIALLLSLGLPQMKVLNLGNDETLDKLSHEFDLQSASKSGKKALEALMQYFIPVIQSSLESMENSENILENEATETSELKEANV